MSHFTLNTFVAEKYYSSFGFRSSLPEMKLFATRSVLEFQPIDLNQNKLQVFGIEINGHNYRAAWTFENVSF